MTKPPRDDPSATPEARSAAFFDVDGTLVASHIVHQYIHVRKVVSTRHGTGSERLRYRLWKAAFYLRCIEYLVLDKASRSRMNIVFYRNYADLSSEEVRAAAGPCFDHVLKPNLFRQASDCIAEHAKAGRRIAFVTGSIDFLIQPLVDYLSERFRGSGGIDLIARTLTERNGRFTGELDGPPIGEQEKVNCLRQYAKDYGIDLDQSYAYGDSIADLPMLQAVGFPQVINGDRPLTRHAKGCGWPIHKWSVERNGW